MIQCWAEILFVVGALMQQHCEHCLQIISEHWLALHQQYIALQYITTSDWDSIVLYCV